MGSPAHNPDSWSIAESARETAVTTSCSVRLWSMDPKEAHWSSEHAVVYLLADLLTASGGQLVLEPTTTLTAQFDRPERALNAARRVQRALYAFTESDDTSGYGASILIHRPEDQVRPQPAVAVPDILWSEFAAPGQILLSGSAHEILQFIPGLQFSPLAVDGNSSPAYQELLWIDPNAQEIWRGRVLIAARVFELQSKDRELDAGVMEGENRAEGSDLATPTLALPTPEYRRTFDPTTVIRWLRTQKRFWMAGGVVFLSVVALLAWLWVPSLPPAPAYTFAAPGPPPWWSDKTRDSGASATQPRSGCVDLPEYGGFRKTDVLQLVRKAGEDEGSGKYENAKDEYLIVLKLDCGNAAARGALGKLDSKMRERP